MVQLLNQSRARQDDAGKLVRTLEREMGALWTFVVEAGVEPTNNRAERALRFAVLWRRMTHGSSNEKGDRWVERLRYPLNNYQACTSCYLFYRLR